MDELRVLLVSPVRAVDPLSGDVTYTEQLLAAPPPGVRYTTYVDALADGTLREHGSRAAVREAPLREGPRELAFALWRKGEHVVRRSGLVFREPLRILEVEPGVFDLIHVHVFHTRFLGEAPPIVMSAGGPLRWVYASAWNWPTWRLRLAESMDNAVGQIWDATICGQRPGRTSRMITLSDDFRVWLIDRGWDRGRIDVAPNYLARSELPGDSGTTHPRLDGPHRLGFIAKDFDAKGGPEVLRAFTVLRASHPSLELWIVGSQPRLTQDELAAQGITWLPLVGRAELLSRVLPQIDILVYPSHFDTSVPYGPTEALAAGIPCVVSDYRALPELVGSDAGAVVPVGDVPAIVEATEGLLETERWEKASRAARARFRARFSSESQAPLLGDAYQAALPHQRSDERMSFERPTTASVVVATYNRPDHVRICLEHLARQTLPPVDTVVVDASPDDRTARVVRDFPHVRYLRNDRGLGHTATSRAIGMAATVGAVVAFVDDDAYAEPKWLAELLRRYDDPEVAAVGGRARNGQPGEEEQGRDEVGLLLNDGRLTGNFAAITSSDLDVDHLLGANMSVRRDVVDRLGGIHDHFPGTCLREETDIVLRMRRSGYRVVYTPDAVVRHVGGTYAKGHRFDLRYQYFGARNHMVLLTHALGFRDPHLRRYLSLAGGAVAADLGQVARAWTDPSRATLREKLRGSAGGAARAAIQVTGLAAGLAASARIALDPRHDRLRWVSG